MQPSDPLPICLVLAQAGNALKTGEFDQLEGLTARLEAALTGLAGLGLAQVQQIRASAAENDRLLSAAIKGVQAAQRRARDLTDQGRFSTYDQGGRRDQPGLTTAQATRKV